MLNYELKPVHTVADFGDSVDRALLCHLMSDRGELLQTMAIYNRRNTRNTLHCDQSIVYSSRVIFSYFSPNLPFYFFSLCRR